MHRSVHVLHLHIIAGNLDGVLRHLLRGRRRKPLIPEHLPRAGLLSERGRLAHVLRAGGRAHLRALVAELRQVQRDLGAELAAGRQLAAVELARELLLHPAQVRDAAVVGVVHLLVRVAPLVRVEGEAVGAQRLVAGGEDAAQEPEGLGFRVRSLPSGGELAEQHLGVRVRSLDRLVARLVEPAVLLRPGLVLAFGEEARDVRLVPHRVAADPSAEVRGGVASERAHEILVRGGRAEAHVEVARAHVLGRAHERHLRRDAARASGVDERVELRPVVRPVRAALAVDGVHAEVPRARRLHLVERAVDRRRVRVEQRVVLERERRVRRGLGLAHGG
jgi:hypothetical protein